MTYGAALNGNILNAWVSGTIPGTFVYSPVAGTVLGAGVRTLSATFNPTDTTDYASAVATVQLTVKIAVLVVGACNFDPLHFGSYILDLAVLNNASQTVTISIGDGTGKFTAATSPQTGASSSGIAVGDFNGDGIPDLATNNGDSNNATVLLGKGDGTFTPTAVNPPAGNSQPIALTAGIGAAPVK